jgi:hypothetical protein
LKRENSYGHLGCWTLLDSGIGSEIEPVSYGGGTTDKAQCKYQGQEDINTPALSFSSGNLHGFTSCQFVDEKIRELENYLNRRFVDLSNRSLENEEMRELEN